MKREGLCDVNCERKIKFSLTQDERPTYLNSACFKQVYLDYFNCRSKRVVTEARYK